MTEYSKMSITIRKDQREWADNHPSVNLSGLLQEALDKKMSEEAQ
jgi:hypothetical protein